MRNWSTDTSLMDKNSEEYKQWRLEQLINFGIDKERLKRSELQRLLSIIDIDPEKRSFLQFLLQKGA